MKRDIVIINSIIKDTQNYSNQYNCSLEEAFKDVVADEPVFVYHAKRAALSLGLDIAEKWFSQNTLGNRDEVNRYYKETYEN